MNTTTTDYELVVDYSPVYELLVSMSVFLQSKNHKSLEAGNEWIRSVQERFAPDFAEKNAVLVSTNELPLEMMILHSPAKHSVEAFLTWFEGLTVGELYEQTAPYVRSVSTDLTTERDYFAWIMREWYETYFKHIDPAILTGLAADAEEKRQLLATMEQGDL
ncbi:MAG: hypothetical protein ACXVC1_10205, partial [Tumebacillaceae bacterium]